MIFSGNSFRKVNERVNYSFDASFSLNNSTGIGAFGFSGEGQTFKFDFVSGRIVDPEGRYVSSYEPNEIFTLQGDVNKGFYNYYINNIPACLSGKKNNFKLQRSFVEASNCEIDSNLFVDASGLGALAITGFPDYFSIGKLFTGKIINTGSGTAFDIFAASLDDADTGNFSIYSFPSKVSGEGDFVLSGVTGELDVLYELDFNFDTSFGVTNVESSVSGFDYVKTLIFDTSREFSEFETLSGTGGYSEPTTGGEYKVEKTGHVLFDVGSGSGYTTVSGSTANVTLEYVSGVTGEFSGMISGIGIISGGSGYIGDYPLIEIQGGGGSGAIVTGHFSNGVATGFSVLNAGSNYTSTPDLIVYKNVALIGVQNFGTGYLSPPEVKVIGGGGSDVALSVGVTDGLLLDVSIISGGTGYTSKPEAHVTKSNVSGVSVFTSGEGYSTGSAIITGGGTGAGAIGAEVYPLFGFQVTGLEIVSGGNHYNNAWGRTGNILFTRSGIGKNGWISASALGTVASQVTGVTLTDSGNLSRGNVGGCSVNGLMVDFQGALGPGGSPASGNPIISTPITGYSGIDTGFNYKLSSPYTAPHSERIPDAVFHSLGYGEGASGLVLMSGYKVSGIKVTVTGDFISGATDITYVQVVGSTGAGGQEAYGVPITGKNYTDPFLGEIHYSITGVNLTFDGRNYTGVPTVEFLEFSGAAHGGGATAVPSLHSGTLSASGVRLYYPAWKRIGYTTGATITISGGNPDVTGSGDLLFSENDCFLAGVDITSGGYYYTGNPTVIFTDVLETMTRVPSGTAQVGNGEFVNLALTSGGRAYAKTPEVIANWPQDQGITEGSTQAVFRAYTGSGQVTGFKIISGGSGYTRDPVVTVTGDGFFASGIATIATGATLEVTMAEGIAGVPLTGRYTKSFENTFNLLTGSGNSESGTWYHDFRKYGKINAAKTKYYDDIVTFEQDQSVINIRVTDNIQLDDDWLVAKLTVSGIGLTSGIFITGTR